jgi:hypothetical protein
VLKQIIYFVPLQHYETNENRVEAMIMDHLRSLPVKSAGELPTIPVDERAAEVRAIKMG